MQELIDRTPLTGVKDDGNTYAAFMVNTLKPFIDSHYNTKPQREFTTIGGSSAGGHMALMLAMEHPEIYGYAFVFSPASMGDLMYKYLKTKNFSNTDQDPYLYIYTGGLGDVESVIGSYTKQLVPELINDGYPKSKINFQVNEKMWHGAEAWGPQFKLAYKWTLDHPYPAITNAKANTPSTKTSNSRSVIKYVPAICICLAVMIISLFIILLFIHKRKNVKSKLKE